MKPFDPRKHPKDRHGQFARLVGDLNHGDSVTLPDGIKVTLRDHKFHATVPHPRYPSTEPITVAHDYAPAAVATALNASAKSRHPDSLGGTRSYTSLRHYEDRERKASRQLRQIQRSRQMQEAASNMQPPSSKEREEFKAKHGDRGVALKKDSKGFFVHTHRARSKSFPSPSAIPKGAVAFVESTG